MYCLSSVRRLRSKHVTIKIHILAKAVLCFNARVTAVDHNRCYKITRGSASSAHMLARAIWEGCASYIYLISAPCDTVLPAKGYSSNMSVCAMMQMGACIEGSLGTAKRPLGDCLEGLVQMLSPLFVQRTYAAGSFLVKQVHPSILSVCVREAMFSRLVRVKPVHFLPSLCLSSANGLFDCKP